MTVFVPVTAAVAQRLRSAGSVADQVGYADGPGLRAWLGDERLSDEEVGYVALNHAGVAALALGDAYRLVLAVDSPSTGTDELGTVTLPEVRWADVRSLFADDQAAAAAVARARAEVEGLQLGRALVAPSVEQLEADHDLLWFSPDELDALTDRS